MSANEKLPEAALEFFRKKGQIGGRRRAANMSPEERSEQARKAVQARWERQAKRTNKRKGTK
jgi:hypothetical protein